MARTENDTWDLATSVGATATMVAAGRGRATQAGLIDDPFAEPLVRAVGVDFFTRWANGELSADEVDIPGHPWGMQPMTDLLAVRTRLIDQFFTDATASGIRQAVILASGLDARGYRLSWPAEHGGVRDRPAAGDRIQDRHAGRRGRRADRRPARSTDRSARRLARGACGRRAWTPSGRPSWVAEGLLAFLPPEAQDRLLDNITELSAEGSRLVVEIFLSSPESLEVMHSAAEKWYEHGLDARIDDLWYGGERHDVAPYLEERGWQTTRHRSGNCWPTPGYPCRSATTARPKTITAQPNSARTSRLPAGTARSRRHARRRVCSRPREDVRRGRTRAARAAGRSDRWATR